MFFVFWLASVLVARQVQAPITALAFTPGGGQAVCGSQAGLKLVSWPDLKEASFPATQLAHINALSFAPDHSVLLVGGGISGEWGGVEIFSWPQLKKLHFLKAHKDLVNGLAWSPDSQRFFTASSDGTCAVIPWKPGTEPAVSATYEGHSRPVLSIVFLQDCNRSLSAGVDQTLQLWEPSACKLERTLDNHLKAVNDLAVKPAGVINSAPVMVASVSEDRTVRLWQPRLGRLVRFTRMQSVPRVVVWAAGGESLTVGLNNSEVHWLDAESPSLATLRVWDAKLGRIHSIAMHPKDGRVLVGGEAGLAVSPMQK